jgi:beta-galactosidase
VLRYGGDYNPEQWPPEVWEEDVALMRRAGVNLVSVGVFSWARLEPREGTFTFGWLDDVLDLLHRGGVEVALATPTASPPPWFSLAYPDALPVTATGTRLLHGSRDTYCVSAPAYRAACRRIAGALADRYAGHPALAMWHVHNEYGTVCHCDHVAAAFRVWLRARYGDLDALNDAWTTAFWSQHYSDWAQVFPPRATQYLPNPTHVLDFRRFSSDELLAAYVEQRDLLRAASPGVPVTTNYVLGGWVPVDHARWAREVDVVAIDHYPADAGPGAEEETAFAADLARGWAGGGSWLLMESAPNLIYTGGRMHAKEPGRMARHSLAHIARGSAGAMFFQWRAPRGGAEMYHSAMVPHAGPESRVFAESAELGAVLGRLGEVAAGGVSAEVAILWDAASWWASQGRGLPSDDLDYAAALATVHGALWRAGVVCDFAAPDADLSAYRLVLAPSLYIVSARVTAALASYVDDGGTLAVWYFSGIVDEALRVWPGGHPGALRDVLGVQVEEFLPLAPGETVGLSTGERGEAWSERVHLAGAGAEVSYAGGRLDGLPAITRHRYGRGATWYVSTRLPRDALGHLLGRIVSAAGAGPTVSPAPGTERLATERLATERLATERLELVRRRDGAASWLFVINHADVAQEVPARGVDLVGGAPVDGTLWLPAGGYAVIREAGPVAL